MTNANKLSNEKSKSLTRKAIRDALIAMLENEKIDDIKIVDLVEKAGVSRAAFYNNYNSVHDVLVDAVQVPVDKIISVLNRNLSSNVRVIIAIFKKNKPVLDILNKTNSLEILFETFNKQFAPDDYYHLAWNGYIYAILVAWVKNGMKESEIEFYEIVRDVAIKFAGAVQNNKV